MDKGQLIHLALGAILFALLRYFDVPTNTILLWIIAASSLYAAGTSFDIYKKLNFIEDELKSIKKNTEN